MKRTSIRDIASSCGTSVTTVSFVLNGRSEEKRISKELADKIIRYVNKIGYIQNHQAKGLRTGKTQTIGLIVENISNSFFSEIAKLIEDSAYKKNYRIMYCSTENNTKRTLELINMFHDRNLDGYIITPTKGIESTIQGLIEAKVPIVLFDRYFADIETDYVTIDNFSGAKKAVSHLVESGFRNIAFVTTESEQSQMADRLSGYEKTIDEHGLQSKVLRLPYLNQGPTNEKLVKKFLEKNKEVDALFFATNYLALIGLAAIKELSLHIPKDLGVIAFDDQEFFRVINPSITAIAQPVSEIAQKLIEILLKKMEVKDKVIEKVVLSPKLIVRESTVKNYN